MDSTRRNPLEPDARISSITNNAPVCAVVAGCETACAAPKTPVHALEGEGTTTKLTMFYEVPSTTSTASSRNIEEPFHCNSWRLSWGSALHVAYRVCRVRIEKIGARRWIGPKRVLRK